jgi:hypothetical protein
MSPTWIALTTSIVLLAVVGWMPRPLRPAGTVIATVLVVASGALAVLLEGARPPFRLAFLGAAIALGLALGRLQPITTTGSRAGRLFRGVLAVGATVASTGLAWAAAVAAVAAVADGPPLYAPPAPSVLVADVVGAGRTLVPFLSGHGWPPPPGLA